MKHLDGPAPGETLRQHDDADSQREQTPDGMAPGVDPVFDPRRTTSELRPVAIQESDDVLGGDAAIVRRTSLDRDDLKPVRVPNRPAEERQDHSTGDGQRENALDPAQDESGPQSDQA